MAYFRIDDHAGYAAAIEAPAAANKPIPRVEIQQVHPEWLIVALIGEKGIEEVKRANNVREAVELAQNLALLGIAKFDGQIQEVRALV